MTIYGQDLSDFDWDRGPVDMAAARNDGMSFVTHKATEGTSVKHARYGTVLERARAAQIEFLGAYLVPRTPGNNGHGSVSAQVDYFLAYVTAQTPWWKTYPGFFFQVDLEHWGYDDVPPAVGVDACRLIRERTGKRVFLYAPQWAYGDSIGGTDLLWASSYGGNPAVPYRQAYPGDAAAAWGTYSGRVPTILQYGSKTIIGKQGTCDANAFRGSAADFRALITGQISAMEEIVDEQLLKTWPVPVDDQGKPDGRGAGVWVADSHAYVWRGTGAYDTGRNDPAGPPNGLYLDQLLKGIRDEVKATRVAAENAAAASGRVLTADQIGALGKEIATTVIETHAQLSDADKPIITDAVMAGVRAVLHGA